MVFNISNRQNRHSAGLNPHSGETGQLGTEEIDWLIPWLESERPFTAKKTYPPADAYLALCHDQGLTHIPHFTM